MGVGNGAERWRKGGVLWNQRDGGGSSSDLRSYNAVQYISTDAIILKVFSNIPSES